MVSLELCGLVLGAAMLASACGEVKREPTECELRAAEEGLGSFFADGTVGGGVSAVCRLQPDPPEWTERGGVQFWCETSSPATNRLGMMYRTSTRPGWVPDLPWGERVELAPRGLSVAYWRSVAIRDLRGELLFGGHEWPHLPGHYDGSAPHRPERELFAPLEIDLLETGCPIVQLGCRSPSRPAAEWARPVGVQVSWPGSSHPPLDLISGARGRIGPYIVLNHQSKEYGKACVDPGVGATQYSLIIAREDP